MQVGRELPLRFTYHPWPSCSRRSSAIHSCHRQRTPPPAHQAFLTRPTEVPRTLQGKKGTRTLATAERTPRGNCCNYFNLNLAMARAVSDTPLLREKVLLDHFNDRNGFCWPSQLKDATPRAAGPRKMGSGPDREVQGTDRRGPV